MNDESMRLTLGMTKALSDIQRLRILMMLRPGELCVCQIIAVLGLAPSTVSKHLSILANARLVDSRKDGRWAYYRLASLADTHAPLDWLATSLRQDGQIRVDQEKLAAINACDPQSIARRQRVSDKIAMTVRRGAPGDRALPELREEDGQPGGAGSPGAPRGGAGSPSTPRGGAGSPSTPRGGADSPSTPAVQSEALDCCVGHSFPQRHKLPHDIPGWIQGSARFFITITCKQRGVNTLCRQPVAEALLDSVRQYEASGRWYLWLALLMPDHLHLIVSIRPDLGLRSVIGNWKRYQATHLGLEWQANFFDHRLRDEEEFRDKAAYIRMNPVRKELSETRETWPFVLDRTNIGAEGVGALGDRALPELREKNAPSGRAGSPSTPNDGGDTENTLQKKKQRRGNHERKSKSQNPVSLHRQFLS
ncbi:MAG: metalloregulator ArsR/SmtB family transcription factor [Lentisphaerae bacterium]|nr:metalloregulator ArsR/SmtB family transcription factor [Lentisphaerota bacterium]